VTITSGEAARRGVFLSQAMQGEEDALAQDHAHDGRLGERDAGPFARLGPGPAAGAEAGDLDGSQRCHRLGVGADAAQLTPDRLWAEAERRISAPEG
jgi:hypothetical protein